MSEPLWYRARPDGGVFDVGLREDMLARIRDECWTIIPNVGNVKKGQPLFAIETSDELLSILSPFNGRVTDVSFVAQNSPEKLTEGVAILTLDTREGARPMAQPQVVQRGVRPDVPPPPRAGVDPVARFFGAGAPNLDEIRRHAERVNQQRVVMDRMWGDRDDGQIPGNPDEEQGW